MTGSTTISLPAEQLLTLSADANSSGTLTRLSNSAGGEVFSPVVVSVSTDPTFGAFAEPRRYLITSLFGDITHTIAPVLGSIDGNLNVTGNISTAANLGSAGVGSTAVESGDDRNHVTTLTVAGVLPDITGGSNQAVGLLVYTFPAGAIIVNHAYISMGVTQSEGNINADTPEVGLGTVIAASAVAVLSTTLENIITGQVAANCTGTAKVKTSIPTAAVPFVIETGAAHTIHFNVADAWAANGDEAATVAGSIIIDWSFIK